MFQPGNLVLQRGVLSKQVIELFIPRTHLAHLGLEHGDLIFEMFDMLFRSLADRSLGLSVIGALSLQLLGRERGDLSRPRAGLSSSGWAPFPAATHDPSGFGARLTRAKTMYDHRAVLEPVLSHKNGVVGDHGGSTRHRDKWMQHPRRLRRSFFETISLAAMAGLILGQFFPASGAPLYAGPNRGRVAKKKGSSSSPPRLN